MTASVPLIEKVVKLTLATVSFAEDAIDAWIEVTPGPVTTVITLDGVAHQDVGTETYALHVNAIIDHDSVRPGLAYYCNAHKGETVAFAFNPHGTGAESASLPQWTGSLKIQPFQIGGKGNEFAEYEVVFPIIGVPLRDATP